MWLAVHLVRSFALFPLVSGTASRVTMTLCWTSTYQRWLGGSFFYNKPYSGGQSKRKCRDVKVLSNYGYVTVSCSVKPYKTEGCHQFNITCIGIKQSINICDGKVPYTLIFRAQICNKMQKSASKMNEEANGPHAIIRYPIVLRRLCFSSRKSITSYCEWRPSNCLTSRVIKLPSASGGFRVLIKETHQS